MKLKEHPTTKKFIYYLLVTIIMKKFNRKYLPEILGLDRKHISEIKNKSINIDVSEKEAKIVNKYTTIDVVLGLLNFRNQESYKSRIERMSKGKVEDYKFFVALYEDNNNSLPHKVENYIRHSPCGKAKMQALEYRFSR
jgi:hypothetical protein